MALESTVERLGSVLGSDPNQSLFHRHFNLIEKYFKLKRSELEIQMTNKSHLFLLLKGNKLKVFKLWDGLGIDSAQTSIIDFNYCLRDICF